jgi:hypothetical protein
LQPAIGCWKCHERMQCTSTLYIEPFGSYCDFQPPLNGEQAESAARGAADRKILWQSFNDVLRLSVEIVCPSVAVHNLFECLNYEFGWKLGIRG